jgi:hypothetical protein
MLSEDKKKYLPFDQFVNQSTITYEAKNQYALTLLRAPHLFIGLRIP